MSSPYTTFGPPPDGVAWGALAAATLLLALTHSKLRAPFAARVPERAILPALSLGAAALSAGYVAFYLHFGPRIIDATSYYLEGRAFSHGHFSIPIPSPSAAFRGRFLLANSSGRALSVIFPPGYPVLLAIGFLLRAPLLIGPILAALTVLSTYALARTLSGSAHVARIAAALSMCCAALRYHTADTMSHGLCALLLSFAALTALRGRRWDALLCGLACGWLLATRPVSGLVAVAIALSLHFPALRRLPLFALGLVPGVALWLAYQHASTGHAWASTQLAYYSLADGPPGCFRYGFGPNIGCLFEHGEYVRARLPHGYGLGEAAAVTLRRLSVHCIDIANAAPLALLCPVGAWLGRKQRGARTLFFGCLGFMLAYAPFYFDGSYPGGGTRLFADLLPLEHVLLALALVRLGWSAFALPVSLLGFAVHASFAHRSLAEREGGRPMFEASVLERAGVAHGLVFVSTDHGFNLGHDPGQLDAQHHLVIARESHDGHDHLLWEQLGRPPSYRYVYPASEPRAEATLSPYLPPPNPRFEGEAEWPPLAAGPGWAHPDFFPCASGGRGLRLEPSPALATVSIELEPSGSADLHLGWVRRAGPETQLRVTGPGFDHRAIVPAGAPACLDLDLGPIPGTGVASTIEVSANRSGLLDYLELHPPQESDLSRKGVDN